MDAEGGAGSVIDASEKYSGSGSYKLVLGTDTSLTYTIDVFPIFDINLVNQKDTEYEFSVMLKLGSSFKNNEGEPLTLRAYAKTDSGKTTEVETEVLTAVDAGNSGWQRVSTKLTLREEYNGNKWRYLDLAIEVGKSSGTVWVDDASLNYTNVNTQGKLDSVFTKTVMDTDEDGSAFCGSDYELVIESANENFSIDPSVSYSGGASVHYSNDETGLIDRLYICIPLSELANDIYYFTVNVRGESLNSYPADGLHGMWVSPAIQTSDGLLYPEVLNYLEPVAAYGADYGYYRTFVNGSKNVPGYYPGSFGSTETPTDVGWTKLIYAINPYAIPSEVISYPDEEVYEFDEDGYLCLYFRFNLLEGDLWMDDFKLFRSGTEEPDYSSSVAITFENGVSSSNIPWDTEFVFPEVTYSYTDEKGNVTTPDVDVKLTLQYKAGAFGWEDVITEKAYTLENRTFKPDKHGEYRMLYTITNENKTTTAKYTLNVKDTLTELILDTSNVYTTIGIGEALELSGLIVKGIYSQSAPDGKVLEGFEIATDYKTGDGAGEYAVTITYVDSFVGAKTVTFSITVSKDVVRTTDKGSDATVTPQITEEPGETDNMLWLWIVIPVAVLAAAGIATWLLLKKKKASQ